MIAHPDNLDDLNFVVAVHVKFQTVLIIHPDGVNRIRGTFRFQLFETQAFEFSQFLRRCTVLDLIDS